VLNIRAVNYAFASIAWPLMLMPALFQACHAMAML
jgi:hypothetical protein